MSSLTASLTKWFSGRAQWFQVAAIRSIEKVER